MPETGLAAGSAQRGQGGRGGRAALTEARSGVGTAPRHTARPAQRPADGKWLTALEEEVADPWGWGKWAGDSAEGKGRWSLVGRAEQLRLGCGFLGTRLEGSKPGEPRSDYRAPWPLWGARSAGVSGWRQGGSEGAERTVAPARAAAGPSDRVCGGRGLGPAGRRELGRVLALCAMDWVVAGAVARGGKSGLRFSVGQTAQQPQPNNPKKTGPGLDRRCPKGDRQTASKHRGRGSTSLVMRETQIRARGQARWKR